MEFYQPRRKSATVPIVPLIDILTILLIFFIVTRGVPRNPPKARPVLQIDLPTVKNVPTAQIAEPRAILAVSAGGKMTLDDYELAGPEFLTDALIVFREKHPERKLELAADKGVTLAQLFLVWDALTAAGIPIKDVPPRIRVPAEVPFVDPLQR